MKPKSIVLLMLAMIFGCTKPHANLPLVAVANYGPHASLQASIDGMKEALAKLGYVENKTVRYEIQDVNFEPALIPQMIVNLKSKNPAVMVVITTPVAQLAKGMIKGIPLVYGVVTDPVDAGLLEKPNESSKNITGSSDRQDLHAFLGFAKQILPKTTRVGLLYASSETNDLTLVKMMKVAAKESNVQVLAVPVDSAREVPLAMQAFKNQVDVIYVGASGPIQPTLPVIAAVASKMQIPVMNVEASAVKEGLVLASFGVSYKKVGEGIGKLVAGVLRGEPIANLKPIYPSIEDHHGVINFDQAKAFGLSSLRVDGGRHVKTKQFN